MGGNKLLEYSVVLILILFNCNGAMGYRPVVLIHGVLATSESMDFLSDYIKEKHPGTEVTNTPEFGGWSSLESMWYQVKKLGDDIMKLSAKYPDGINLLGYSQGGLLARAILQSYPEHNVHNFISLSSPQAGQYGDQFLHLIFPNLVCAKAYELFYSRIGQHTSVGNYWNDPYHQDLYFKYSQFLPFINNEIASVNSTYFKQGMTKLNKLILIGGPDDGVITPWQSSQFGYFEKKNTQVIEMRDRLIYQTDAIGLKSLDKQKRLILHTVEDVPHIFWPRTPEIIDHYILPYLD